MKKDRKRLLKWLAAGSNTDDQRPALTEIGTMHEISMVLNQRQNLYEKSSDLTINTKGKTPEEVAEIISAELKKEN